MNEELRKLMVEADYAAPHLAGRAHKLAELIVRECANKVHEYQDMRIPASQYQDLLLAHFGYVK